MILASTLSRGEIFTYLNKMYVVASFTETALVADVFMFQYSGKWRPHKTVTRRNLPLEVKVQRVRVKVENY